MSKDIDVPTEYTIHSTVSGGLDLDLDNIRIKEIPPLELTTTNRLTSNSSLASTMDIRIKELPRIDVGLQLSMKPTRVHFPVHLRLGLSTIGFELLSFSICGESMVIVEDYVPHKTESCF